MKTGIIWSAGGNRQDTLFGIFLNEGCAFSEQANLQSTRGAHWGYTEKQFRTKKRRRQAVGPALFKPEKLNPRFGLRYVDVGAFWSGCAEKRGLHRHLRQVDGADSMSSPFENDCDFIAMLGRLIPCATSECGVRSDGERSPGTESKNDSSGLERSSRRMKTPELQTENCVA